METRWLYRTSENLAELRDASKGVCVIPMGCVEKHGLHLPMGQDIIQASHLAWMASQLETVCVFPDYIFGDVPGKSPTMPLGSITLSLDLEIALLEELCESISRAGFKKIVVFNGHGGNKPWLSTFLRIMSAKKRDFVVVVIDIGLPAPHEMAKEIEENGRNAIPELTEEDVDLILKYHEQDMKIGHACMGETAYMMGISPEHVHLDRLGIESGLSAHKTDYLLKAGILMSNAGWDIDYANAFSGDDPIGCNERIGKAALRMEAERVSKAFKVLKEDENLLRWLEEYQLGWDD